MITQCELLNAHSKQTTNEWEDLWCQFHKINNTLNTSHFCLTPLSTFIIMDFNSMCRDAIG